VEADPATPARRQFGADGSIAVLGDVPRYINRYIVYHDREAGRLAWVVASRLRAFPAEARRAAGYQIGRVQQGLMPDDWKPMMTVGAGVYEIRIRTGLEHRVFYLAKYDEAVYVVHASKSEPGRREKAISLWRVSVLQI
jgi:phage-related protein